jgi:hypothetical protein
MSRVLWFLLTTASFASELQFRETTLATQLAGGYQTTIVDVNGDGKPDIVALATGATELLWFEGPAWTRHVLASPIERPINLAAADTDGDRIPEIVVAAGWSNVAAKSPGTVLLLTHNGDPRQKWSVREIDKLPTSHRIRVMKLDGKPVFVNAPLIAATAEAPDYRGATPLVLYRPGVWKREFLSEENQGVVHGLNILDWDRDGRDDIVTASFDGVHWFSPKTWKRTQIVPGDSSPWPKSGASDALTGQANRQRFLATIEPWHGNQICVYIRKNGKWVRNVINDADPEVHALAIADLDSDGNDDIVAAVRGKPGRVVVYLHGKGQWTRQVVDEGGITAAQCSVADLNGDRRPDLACIGSATANLKVFENLGRR